MDLDVRAPEKCFWQPETRLTAATQGTWHDGPATLKLSQQQPRLPMRSGPGRPSSHKDIA